MYFDTYLKSIQKKTVSIVGIGVSNMPLLEALLAHGISVVARDKHSYDEIKDIVDKFSAIGCSFKLGDDYLKNLKEDIIFRTPGLRPDVPEIQAAVDSGSILTSEMELFFELCPCKTIAVTGSDGKTTTTSIIAGILSKAGYTVHVGGNIGHPLLCEIDSFSKNDIAVLELSSFQLLTMKNSPDIAVITNVAPNHLDVHKNMQEYIDAKKNIFLHQTSRGKCIVNHDCEITRDFLPSIIGTAFEFSRVEEVSKGIYLKNDKLYFTNGDETNFILNIQDIRIPGMHNVENYMAAILTVLPFVSLETITSFAREFAGVEHRIEFVRNYHGVSFYNDSIASSPSRTIAGLRSFKQKVILIAGGYDKHIPFDVLGPEIIEHVKILVLCGATSEKIEKVVNEQPNYAQSGIQVFKISSFEKAVETARDLAFSGDIVTLSPACAAFDQFKNFMVRGDTFKKIVNSWVE